MLPFDEKDHEFNQVMLEKNKKRPNRRDIDMSLVRCPKGHYYDDRRFSSCPSCGINLEGLVDGEQAIDAEEKTVCRLDMNENLTVCKLFDDDDVKTIAKFQMENGTRPVAGWLVCIEGCDKGCDYRIYAGINHAGRGDTADIRFYGDEQISRGVHFIIIYDPKQNLFFLIPGEGTITLLNEIVVIKPQELKPYDRIKVGQTAFDFIPYCIGGHHW